MKAKTKPTTKRIAPKRKKAAVTQAGFIALAETAVPQLAHHSHRVVRKGTKLVTKLIEQTGLPEGYSATIAWFAERVVLASICLITLSFAAGVMFVLRLSEPIAESQAYDALSHKATLAQQGIREYSQQVIDIASPVFAQFVKDNHEPEVDLEDQQLAERKAKLKAYYESKNSPFAGDDAALEAFATSKNMKMMMGIAFVESTHGQHCYYYNCSGITGQHGLRQYQSYAEWIHDFDNLLERRYKDLPPEKFIGLYVQPGSDNWTYGVKQVIKELHDEGIS